MSDNYPQQPVEILVIAVSVADTGRLEDELAEVAPRQFLLESAASGQEALEVMRRKTFNLIILDISAPGEPGFEMFLNVKDEAGDTPIVVLTGLDDEKLAINAVNTGAQDYIVKGHVNSRHLAQSLHYAIVRQKLRDRLVNQALVDELTGLYNRRGFLSLARQQLLMADRTKRSLLLFFLDLDGLKRINDTQGHHAGDMALADTASVIRESFRHSDILARIGGDEFAVLALETAVQNQDVVLRRITRNVEIHNVRHTRPYRLSLSVGVATYNPQNPQTVENMIAIADALMYQDKRRKRAERM